MKEVLRCIILLLSPAFFFFFFPAHIMTAEPAVLGSHGHSEVVVFAFLHLGAAIYPVREGYNQLTGEFFRGALALRGG